MPDRNALQKLLRGKINGAISLAKAASGFTHQGLKGEAREILIAQLFRPLLPSDIGVGTGQILCSYSGRLSSQVDIILYDQSILPPVLIDDRVGIFPIESVLYAIEVKSVLTAGELASAHNNALKLEMEFGYRPGLKTENGKEKQHSLTKVTSAVFALSSKLKKSSEAERYIQIHGKSAPAIRAICVADREYWFEASGFWYGTPEVEQSDPVLAFLTGVMNTYRSTAKSRGYPLLGHYIAPDGPVTAKLCDLAIWGDVFRFWSVASPAWVRTGAESNTAVVVGGRVGRALVAAAGGPGAAGRAG